MWAATPQWSEIGRKSAETQILSILELSKWVLNMLYMILEVLFLKFARYENQPSAIWAPINVVSQQKWKKGEKW
jgi:hypothetical protein